MTAFCPVCGYGYLDGLPGERRKHAGYHTAYMNPRRPKPDPHLAVYTGDVRVDGESPRWLHRLVYKRAYALQQDEGYDFPQWRKDPPPRMRGHERDQHALLLVEDGNIPVGVVGFVWASWSNAPAGWHMFMAWVADEWQRKGVMSRRWPAWRQTYGDFTLEHPNEAMWSFLRTMQVRT